jgi:hypothetical protein
VKITNGEIYNDIRPALGKLIQTKLPVKTAFVVARFAKKTQEFIESIENVRNNLITQYGETGKTGQPIINPKSESWEPFSKEYNELMEIEVEFPDTKIILPGSIEIEASVLLQLEKFVEIA